jgi:uncharacterized membrane protein
MLGRSKTAPLKDSAATLKELTMRFAQTPALANRFSDDRRLQRQVERAQRSIRKALKRVERRQSHRLRNVLIALGIVGAASGATVLVFRKLRRGRPRTIDASIEVGVPVTTAYNQWTQFEDFPLFMEGVDHVQQLDPARLRWAATVAGRRAEWDAKILEQHPDRQISWISEDGKKTRGTVTFEERGAEHTVITLSMSYQAEDVAEAAGSTAGLDDRRVRGDLERFKELIEARGAETGAWRGEISAGATQ